MAEGLVCSERLRKLCRAGTAERSPATPGAGGEAPTTGQLQLRAPLLQALQQLHQALLLLLSNMGLG